MTPIEKAAWDYASKNGNWEPHHERLLEDGFVAGVHWMVERASKMSFLADTRKQACVEVSDLEKLLEEEKL
jgi:hypothetical protein